MTSGTAADQKLNADVPWDDFDPGEYISHNYLTMQAVDQEIVSRMRDHFSSHFGDHFPDGGRVPSGIDVGAGPNLYPALAMLPWCDRITLLERSARNLKYLRSQRADYAPHWDQFWDVLCQDEAYAKLDVAPRVRFKEAVRRPESGSLFDLGTDPRRWDLGTMFFVAESITTSLAEFRRGVGCFMNALNPGAPFAAAFMEHSVGYRVGDVEFPARDIDDTEVETALGDLAQDMKMYHLDNPGDLVRDGYTGMILVCGRRSDSPV
ncbi:MULTISPECIES: SCO2525 family SAM-dependent methyltransferase [Streptomyces]|uniref:SCO2525 family SAM-dependent methyltransferase n=2 Tax=Streptomyces TaxID=1883 RepID=A0ABV9J2S8_9ACTN